MAGYKLTRSSPGCKIKSYGLNHIEEMHPAVDQDRAAYTKILRAPGSAPLSLLHSCPGEVRMIPSRGGPAPSIHVFTPRVQLRRRAAHHHRTAHLKLAEVLVGGGGAWPGSETTHRDTPRTASAAGVERLAAVPVGGGGAWPGSETTHRAKLAARTAHGRATAHQHTQRPGPTKHTRRPKHQQNPQQEGIPPAVELISYLVPLFFLYRGKRAGNSGGCNPSDRRRLC